MCDCNDNLTRQYLIKATMPPVYVVTRVESCTRKCLRRLLRDIWVTKKIEFNMEMILRNKHANSSIKLSSSHSACDFVLHSHLEGRSPAIKYML